MANSTFYHITKKVNSIQNMFYNFNLYIKKYKKVDVNSIQNMFYNLSTKNRQANVNILQYMFMQNVKNINKSIATVKIM